MSRHRSPELDGFTAWMTVAAFVAAALVGYRLLRWCHLGALASVLLAWLVACAAGCVMWAACRGQRRSPETTGPDQGVLLDRISSERLP